MASRSALVPIVVLALIAATRADAALPPVPVPPENPLTEQKRVLGKTLFWDEQLSSDNTVACGTCHRPATGGADPRMAVHPRTDPGTIDDVYGSPGIVALDADGRRVRHPVFGDAPQVTTRASQSIFGALWAAELFWDGRSSGELRDPVSGDVVIAAGGALESQVLATLVNDVEMAKRGRAWREIAATLERVRPLALATDLPRDVAASISRHADYPALFAAAFGDPAITPVRIAFAIAAYERTLVADATPWDGYTAGDQAALTRGEQYGWQAMQDFNCVKCHTPPLFTNDDFFNIGLRRSEFDRGRENVTGDPEDAGAVRVPTLRNAALRMRFMHTGELASLGAAIGFYRTGPALPDRDDIPGGGIYAFNMSPLTEADIRTFLSNALVDPRVRAEEFPFDRPRLRSERGAGDTIAPEAPARLEAERGAEGVRLRWTEARDDTGTLDYVVQRGEAVIALVTATEFIDRDTPRTTTYRIVARDAAGNESPAASIEVDAP